MITTRYVPGSPVWLDLGAHDIPAAAAFYGDLFGWEFASQGPETGGYGLLQLDGRNVAAIGPLSEPGARPSWTVYFHTKDADATMAAVERAGGTVRFAPYDVFALGRMAGFTDPTGAEFAVWQPGEMHGLDVVDVPNSLCWIELYTTKADTARGFYRSVFSWEIEDNPMGEGMLYSVLSPPGGGRDNAFGGLMQLPAENLEAGGSSQWHPYFEVADCDATVSMATTRGATVMIPPLDMEGIGRMAMFADPFGATLAVITSSPAETAVSGAGARTA